MTQVVIIDGQPFGLSRAIWDSEVERMRRMLGPDHEVLVADHPPDPIATIPLLPEDLLPPRRSAPVDIAAMRSIDELIAAVGPEPGGMLAVARPADLEKRAKAEAKRARRAARRLAKERR